jgi:molecular chaperone GrpE
MQAGRSRRRFTSSDMSKKPTIKELQEHVDELTHSLKRERADSENIRRRHDEQIAGLKTMVKIGVIRDLLPVLDNFERALKHVPTDLKDNDYVKGVSATVAQFEKTLQQLGVQRIKTVEEVFNPSFHEAVSLEGEGGKEIISEELQAGYTLGDEVVRHAMVKVELSNG